VVELSNPMNSNFEMDNVKFMPIYAKLHYCHY